MQKKLLNDATAKLASLVNVSPVSGNLAVGMRCLRKYTGTDKCVEFDSAHTCGPSVVIPVAHLSPQTYYPTSPSVPVQTVYTSAGFPNTDILIYVEAKQDPTICPKPNLSCTIDQDCQRFTKSNGFKCDSVKKVCVFSCNTDSDCVINSEQHVCYTDFSTSAKSCYPSTGTLAYAAACQVKILPFTEYHQ